MKTDKKRKIKENVVTIEEETVCIDDFFLEGCMVMVGEPLKDVSIEEIEVIIRGITTAQELVAVYASVDNKFWYLALNLEDFEMDTPEYNALYKLVHEWKNLMEKLQDKIIMAATEEKLLIPGEENAGLVKQLSAFMEKYGFRDVNGWWVEK